jgi:hypothetical protein
VAHIGNSSYSQAEIRIEVRSQPRQIVCEILSWKKSSQKRAGGVAQDVGSEFKLHYHKKQQQTPQNFTSLSSGNWGQKSRTGVWWESTFVHRWCLLSMSSHGERSVESPSGLFYKGTNPILEAPPPLCNHFPRAPHPNTITLGVRISTCERDTNTQTMALASHAVVQFCHSFCLLWVTRKVIDTSISILHLRLGALRILSP